MNGYGLYINGEWVDSLSGQTFQTRDPATGEILATFPKGTAGDVHKAIEAAERDCRIGKATLHQSGAKSC